MSWLANKIKNVLRVKGDSSPALLTMIDEIEQEYNNRHKQMRLHDKDGEGILYGRRKNSRHNTLSNAFELTCSAKMLARGKEEAYSRALFNQKQLFLGGGPVSLISYEAALLRKESGDGGGICKLDLVGLDNSTIWAIEYKQGLSPVTTTRYGILEAFAYGFLIACHLRDSKEKLKQQIETCTRCRGPYRYTCTSTPTSVKFAVAAPPSFYREDIRTARRLALTDNVCKLAINSASDLSERIGIPLSFGGFLVIGDDNTTLVDNRDTDNSTVVVPNFKPTLNNVSVFAHIQQVQQHVKTK